MHQKSITLEQAVEECGVKPEYIEKLMNNPDKLPSAGTLYKLAELLDVTPDYLGGFTDDPDGRSPHTPKPKDLVNFLKQEDVMFHGVPLNEEDKQKIENVLIGLFWESKQMNKRKKK
ncbi:helix-turn-helix domain-containing protein [Aneurinibacillus thermoaerophilus]|uniref:helix-turn-helix domain-containing protein n=1 Tax=Aneurinibacillus thermoaerophilus TaxID=143495 RepID=UPI00399C944B